jgi:hypothetical protein
LMDRMTEDIIYSCMHHVHASTGSSRVHSWIVPGAMAGTLQPGRQQHWNEHTYISSHLLWLGN